MIAYYWNNGAFVLWPEASNEDLKGLINQFGPPDKIVVLEQSYVKAL